MGFFDKLTGKKQEPEEQKKAEKAPEPEGKYNEACSFCGGLGTEKKWMGQYWHKKCLRNVKHSSRKMI